MAAAYTRQEFHQLTSGESGMVGFGEIDWRDLNGSWRGGVPVAGPGFEYGDLRLVMRVGQKKPSEPSVILVVRSFHMKRVDVNGMHEGERSTHVQWYQSPADPEQFDYAPNSFLDVPLSDTVSKGTYRRIFQEASSILNVDVKAVAWTDPPGMG